MIAGLAGFADGFAGAVKMKRDQKREDEANARADRYLSIMEKNPGAFMGGGMGLGGYGAPPAPGAAAAAPGGTGTPGDASVPTGAGGGLFGLIDKTEGGGNYDTLFGHSQNGGRFDGTKVSSMTLAELYDFSNPRGEYGQWVKANNPAGVVATPMGRHQIVGTTLRATAEAMGLSPDTVFTPQVQDSMANYLARNRIAGLSGMPAKRAALRSEWEGFKHVSDAALDAAILNFEANGMGTRPMGIGPS